MMQEENQISSPHPPFKEKHMENEKIWKNKFFRNKSGVVYNF